MLFLVCFSFLKSFIYAFFSVNNLGSKTWMMIVLKIMMMWWWC